MTTGRPGLRFVAAVACAGGVWLGHEASIRHRATDGAGPRPAGDPGRRVESSARVGAAFRWPDMRINVNTAGAAELSVLPRIGPGLAERVVADRTLHGPYASLDELARVSRIGPVTVAELRPFAVAETGYDQPK